MKVELRLSDILKNRQTLMVAKNPPLPNNPPGPEYSLLVVTIGYGENPEVISLPGILPAIDYYSSLF